MRLTFLAPAALNLYFTGHFGISESNTEEHPVDHFPFSQFLPFRPERGKEREKREQGKGKRKDACRVYDDELLREAVHKLS